MNVTLILFKSKILLTHDGWNAIFLSRMRLLELFHVLDQLFNVLLGHSIVDRRANTT